MTIEIRLLGSEDARVLDTVAGDVFDFAVIPEQAERFLSDPAHFIVVAIDDGVVVGMGSANEYLHPDKPVQFWINEMGVAPAYRRRGIGTRLLARLIELARERGRSEVWLGTEQDNEAARGLYRSLGGAEKKFVMYTFAASASDGSQGDGD